MQLYYKAWSSFPIHIHSVQTQNQVSVGNKLWHSDAARSVRW